MPEAVDTKLALSRLTAAADNVDELAWAIEEASFLDSQPGDNRQKLRGQPTFMSETKQRIVAASAKRIFLGVVHQPRDL